MKKIYSISDLHLSGNVPFKPMDKFGWPSNYKDLIAKDWDDRVKANDYVLIPGDISWSSIDNDSSKEDFMWISNRPGIKILSKGNHEKGWGLLQRFKNDKMIFVNNRFENDDLVIFAAIGEDIPYLYYEKKKVEYKHSLKEIMKWHSFLTHMCNAMNGYFGSDAHSVNKDKLHIFMCHTPPVAHDFQFERKIFDKFDLIISGHIHSEEHRDYLYNEDQYKNVVCDLNDFKLTELTTL